MGGGSGDCTLILIFIMYILFCLISCSSVFILTQAFTSSSCNLQHPSPYHPPNHWNEAQHYIKVHHNICLQGSKENTDKDYSTNEHESKLPPLFVEAKESRTYDNNAEVSISSLIQSIERVRRRLQPNTDDTINNDDILKQIVQEGIKFKQTQSSTNDNASDGASTLSSQMERVPGCIATVHLQTTLINISDNLSSKDPKDYRANINGNADALLSGGLLAILADIFSGNRSDVNNTKVVSASDILKLDPEILTTSIGLQSILSRGRNDGMASMVRVVQGQIQSLLNDCKDDVDNSKVIQLLESTTITSNIDNHDTINKPSVAMLLSGGVDSSVALHLLLRQNYNVTAFYLRIWLEDELAHLGECPWEDDLQVCQEVCEHAGNVPLETVSLGKEYRESVVQYTIEEAQRGRTPNPDIMCNSRVKFGCFLDYIEESGMEFDYIASGHYARLEDVTEHDMPAKKRLFRAPDPVKDQSYFLCALTQQQLSKVIFPIGTYQKSEVRELASHFQLPNRNRPDSQGLCFLGKVKFDDFLSSYLGNRPGDVVDALNGEVIGRHNGLWYHTVGQRKGIGKVMFPLATARGPWYVVAKDQSQDIVYVSNRYDKEDFAKARSEFEVEDVRWILGGTPTEMIIDDSSEDIHWKEVRIDMKIRHGPRIVKGSLLLKDDGLTGNVCLDIKDGGLAPGQYVVFYKEDTDECLGAGVISEKHWSKYLQDYQETTFVKAKAS